MLKRRKFKPGDWVVFRKTKHSIHPGRRAENVIPAKGGDTYTYQVDKYWVVQEVRGDGTLLLLTRRGKLHEVSATDLSLRGANWWDRFRHRARFEAIEREGKKAADSDGSGPDSAKDAD